LATKIETYTFLVSGVFSENAPRLIRALDTNYPVIQMDVIDNYSISMPNRISNYAIESRSNISDHIFSENIKLQFTARVGHAYPLYSLDLNSLIKSDKNNSIKANKPQQAYELIKKLRDDKLAFDVLTEQELFEGMVITDLSVAREAGDDQLIFNISLEKFRKVNIGKTVLASVNTGTDKGKELSKKTANKTSEGGKTSGDTSKTAKQGNTDVYFYDSEAEADAARSTYSKEISEGKVKIVTNSGRNISENR
jgi:hypothetical protein